MGINFPYLILELTKRIKRIWRRERARVHGRGREDGRAGGRGRRPAWRVGPTGQAAASARARALHGRGRG
uniref:Uncharacterized protein n=1 Tax=Oryza sativa subsp. japonica TaxID=39947 RepID=Q654R3_ORYSJ|nr:hypothetical protein [Oryza sativa Japonica Group]BAD52612.1 hypothetical protein [Oryza sativa Japonica Group]